MRLLIAEDDPITADLLADLAAQEGHEVSAVVSKGAEVLPRAREVRPDVVLMDLNLADKVSGIAATKAITRVLAVPVIVVSGTEDAELMAAVAECGALGFMKKPVSTDELRINLQLAHHHNIALHSIKESEYLHRSIFDKAAVGIYIGHPGGYFLTVNNALARMLGYVGMAEILRGVRDIGSQLYEDPARYAELLEKLSRGQEIEAFEARLYGRDGDLIWVEQFCTPSLDKDGKLVQYEGVAINIDARKKAEAALQLSNSILANTMDAVPEGIVVLDLAENIIMLNSAAKSMLGPVADEGHLRCLTEDDPGRPYVCLLTALRKNELDRAEYSGKLKVAGLGKTFIAEATPYLTPEGAAIGVVLVLRQAG